MFSWENFLMQIRQFSPILLKHLSCGWPIFTNTSSILLATRVLPRCPDVEQEWSGPNCPWEPFHTYTQNPECVIEELFKKSLNPHPGPLKTTVCQSCVAGWYTIHRPPSSDLLRSVFKLCKLGRKYKQWSYNNIFLLRHSWLRSRKQFRK